MKTKLMEIVYRAIESESAMLPTPIDCSLENSTPLFGENGQLDSLSLVSLIVHIEEQLDDQLGLSLILASEKAMSARRSPFATIGSLVDYIDSLAQEMSHV